MSAPFVDGFDIKLHTAWINDEKKGKRIRTDAIFRITFKDKLTGDVVADLVMTPASAKNLSVSLAKTIEKLNRGDIKPKKLIKDHHHQQGYIG